MLRRSTGSLLFAVTAPRLLSAEGQERAAIARKELQTLWSQQLGPLSSNVEAHRARSAEVRKVMDEAKMDPALVSREDDATKALGEYFDRMLLMLVPLTADTAPYLERALKLAARSGFEIQVKTMQHLFARTATYGEALTIFQTMRKCGVKMKMESYYAMVHCLQRLEEESWGRRFYEEFTSAVEKQKAGGAQAEEKSGGGTNPSAPAKPVVTAQALDFIVAGCSNQLIPESKPWLGRVMFADTEIGTQQTTDGDFDFAGDMWVERYKDGSRLPDQVSRVKKPKKQAATARSSV